MLEQTEQKHFLPLMLHRHFHSAHIPLIIAGDDHSILHVFCAFSWCPSSGLLTDSSSHCPQFPHTPSAPQSREEILWWLTAAARFSEAPHSHELLAHMETAYRWQRDIYILMLTIHLIIWGSFAIHVNIMIIYQTHDFLPPPWITYITYVH